MNGPIIAYRANMGVQTSAPFTNTYSLNFDGIDDFVSTNSKIIGSDITLSGWVNFNGSYSVFSAHFPMSITPSNLGVGNETLGRFYKNGSKLQIAIQCNDDTGGNFSTYFVDSTTLEGAGWQHICLTYNVTTKHIYAYLNGVAQNWVKIFAASTPVPFLTAVSGRVYESNLTIGRLNTTTSTGTFLGLVDEVSTYDKILTQAEITSISAAPSDLTNLSPTVWLRNGDNGSYKSPQWLIPNNENFAANKVSNYSLSFDGIDDKVELGTQSFGITGAISVSAWVKIPTSNTGGGGTNIQVIAAEDRTSGTNRNWLLYWRGGGLNQIVAIIWDSGAASIGATTTAIVPNDGVWHHLMFTYTGDTSTDGLKLFVDGIQRAQATSSNGGLRSTTSVVPTIGGLSQAITWMFEGNIDEVSIFNTDQSANISTIYNSGEPTTLPSGAIAHYKMGEEANFTSNWLVDNSALDNYSKRSFEFDGIDDYIDCGDITELDNVTSASWSMWANSNITSSYHNLISCFSTGFKQYLIRQYSTRLEVYIAQSSGTLRLMNTSNFSFAAGTWFHIAIIYDESEASNSDKVKVYIDGALQSNTVAGFALTSMYTSRGNATEIGKVGGFTTKQYNGNIDEVAIFDSAISIGDVWDGSGEPIDVSSVSGIVSNYRMGEDASFNGTDWTVPDQVGSNTGTSANMDISDLVGEAPNYSGGGISANMTIEDRVGEAPNSSNNALSFNMDLVDRTTNVPA